MLCAENSSEEDTSISILHLKQTGQFVAKRSAVFLKSFFRHKNKIFAPRYAHLIKNFQEFCRKTLKQTNFGTVMRASP
jgi:hypothetical protein